jgi:hypothetical protein
MHKYFPATHNRDKNPSQNKIKHIQSRPLLNSLSGAELKRSETDVTQSMKVWMDDRKEHKEPKNTSCDKRSESSNNYLNGKEMSTMKLIGRIQKNIGSIEAIINGMFEESVASS